MLQRKVEWNAVEKRGKKPFQKARETSKMASDNGNNNMTINIGKVLPKVLGGNSRSSCSAGDVCVVIFISLFSP